MASSASISYHGTWSTTADPTAAGGQLHASDAADARATFTFTGRDVAWVAERGPMHGKPKVYVDGERVKTIDLATGSDTPRRIVFTEHWASAATHHLKVVVAGTASRPTVDVDGFLVLR